ACMYICPHDLMKLTEDKTKALNQEPVQCWECYNCVKICPQQAIEVRCYADFAPLGASCIPLRGTDTIMWTIKFRDGMIKRFKFPIRTVEEGQLSISAGVQDCEVDLSRIKEQGLYTQQAAGVKYQVPA
ncbi:MAG: adenylyl-sulfate reductase subunit beta, partial [Proteobacteria bacterium]|nr:adenylyl-sulfate reductase subunit beta [Pseudomonadota bacterium]